MIDRLAATRQIAARLTDQLVVTGFGNVAFDVFELGDRPLNFYSWGAMGVAASVALGLALAQPERQVVLIEGDGSLLMNLGALATIGRVAPSNLACLILDNERFQITGGQPTSTAHGATDLAGVARACGFAAAEAVVDGDALGPALETVLSSPGPRMLVAKVGQEVTKAYLPRNPVLIKYRFMHALGTAPEVDALAWGQHRASDQ
jgi:thiamine pyrophosphate-dependent acetolactate synthase large subunit-like protein